VRGTVNLRKDRQVFIPYSDNSLMFESRDNYNSGLNLELVFDNTIPMELNIQRGTRFKFFAEYLQELGGNYDPTFNLGFDFRNYTRIARNFIWVNRLAGATSLGDRKLLYYMGGVDNWVLRPQEDFDQSIQLTQLKTSASKPLQRRCVDLFRTSETEIVFYYTIRIQTANFHILFKLSNTK
jgi:hypothetical protein